MLRIYNKMKTNWDEVIRKAYENSRKLGVPNIDYEDGYVILSTAYVTAVSLKKLNAIDAGAGVGFSTVWMARALEESEVTGIIFAVERDLRRFNALVKLVNDYKLKDMIVPVNEDAMEYAKKVEDVNFVFIDIDKHLYLDFFKIIKDKVQKGGVVLAHNVNYRFGSVRSFLKEASEEWKTIVVPTSEGISISIKV